jgi:integrase/recombinase XerD
MKSTFNYQALSNKTDRAFLMPKNKERMMEVDNNAVLTEMSKKIRLKGYSQNTLKAYVDHVRRLADYFECNVDELNSLQLEEYLLTVVQDTGDSASYVNPFVALLVAVG